MIKRLWALLRHAWLDASDNVRLVSPDALKRLEAAVQASERHHQGEIRLVIESALPVSYLWRHVRHATPIAQLAHQRAVMLFGRLRVWDTELNNGVLIYLLLAERRIELLADRALSARVDAPQWRGMVERLGQALAQGQFEAGLLHAIEEVSGALEQHFPAVAGSSNPNELEDRPRRL